MDSSPDEAIPDARDGADRAAGAKVPAEAPRRRGSRQLADPDLLSFNEAKEGPARGSPPHWDGLFGYGSQAALAVCLFGFAWAAGSYFSGERSPLQLISHLLPAQTESPQEAAERAELSRNVQKMAADIHSLQASLEALRATQSQTAKGVTALEGLTTRLDTAKRETSAAISALTDKVDRIQREPDAKLSQVIDRLDRIEREFAAPPAASSIGAATAAAAQKQPQISVASAKQVPEAVEGQKKPRLITSWIVRDVYDGTALIENPQGTIEVAPGDIIPGAGRVKSIERRGSGWIVITSEGVVDSIRDRF
jgi:TolA-binding protein